MSTPVVSIRVDAEPKKRLDALSASTGRPAAFSVREAPLEHLDELEPTSGAELGGELF